MAYQIQIESAAPLPLKQKNKFINQLKILKMLPKTDPHKILAWIERTHLKDHTFISPITYKSEQKYRKLEKDFRDS